MIFPIFSRVAGNHVKNMKVNPSPFMDTLKFNVVPVNGRELSEIKKEKIMEHVQNLLEHVGMYIVTAEMGFQGSSPDAFRSKFCLSSEPKERENRDTVLETALVWLENTLDIAGTGMVDNWLSSTYTDPRYRVAIAKELMALCDELDGDRFSYGRGKNLKDFLNADAERFRKSSEADVKKFTCALAGVIDKSADGKGRKGYKLNTGAKTYDITLWKEFDRKNAENLSGKNSCLISGLAVMNDEGDIAEVRNLCGGEEFPGIVFNRMITPERDIVLLNPLTAEITFDRTSGKWTLNNEFLGISSSGSEWNKTVSDFHEYFVFLWETYVEGEKEELSEEETELKEYLLSMVPF